MVGGRPTGENSKSTYTVGNLQSEIPRGGGNHPRSEGSREPHGVEARIDQQKNPSVVLELKVPRLGILSDPEVWLENGTVLPLGCGKLDR